MAAIEMTARMEAYSVAYAHAIAAAAGVATGSITPDINSLDVQFLSPDDGAQAGSSSHVQLKSTATALRASTATPNCKTYRLRLIDYERLRRVTRVPRLLVVLEVPADADTWLECGPDKLVLNASARWVSLRGYEATTYQSQVPIDLPDANVFTPAALLANMASLDEAV
jgi:hypothetical protein